MDDNKKEERGYIGDKLEDRISDALDALSDVTPGTEASEEIIGDVVRLGNLWVDIKKVETDFNDHEAQREHEEKVKSDEAKQSRNTKLLEVGITAGITATVAVFRALLAKKMYNTTLKCEYCDDRSVLNRNFQGLFNSTWRP